MQTGFSFPRSLAHRCSLSHVLLRLSWVAALGVWVASATAFARDFNYQEGGVGFVNFTLGVAHEQTPNSGANGVTLGLINFTGAEGYLGGYGSLGKGFIGGSGISLIDYIVLDFAVGYGITQNFWLGLAPLSVNISQAPNLGVSVLGFLALGPVVVEAKVVPYSWTAWEKHEDGKWTTPFNILQNNSYLGIKVPIGDSHEHYRQFFGLRWNGYGALETTQYNVQLEWGMCMS